MTPIAIRESRWKGEWDGAPRRVGALVPVAALLLSACFDNPFGRSAPDFATQPPDFACPPGEVFFNTGCCRPTPPDCCGQLLCNGACIDRLDSNNCGQCGNVCTRGSHCEFVDSRGPSCSCPAGLTRCGDRCVDTQNDTLNCGGCNAPCPSPGCSLGECCNHGGSSCRGQCADLFNGTALNDPRGPPLYCGVCGVTCPTCTTCVDGQCRSNCSYANCYVRASGCLEGPGVQCLAGQCGCAPGHFTACVGSPGCIDITSDPAHCGACDTHCAQGQLCSRSMCKAQCDPGLTACVGACVDLSTSHTHCGRCGNACTGGTACVNGQCACPAGQTPCNGTCVALDSDAAHCGACGKACGANQWCVKGSCVCRNDLTMCGGVCVSLEGDVNNCGACGHACPKGEDYRCVGGLCV